MKVTVENVRKIIEHLDLCLEENNGRYWSLCKTDILLEIREILNAGCEKHERTERTN